MSFILVPQSGEHVQVNAWNWRPTLAILYRENLLGLESFERLAANGCGGKVDAELASRIADAIERKLESMKPGERILADVNDLYSATYEWLVRFQDFCRGSGDFGVS